MENEPPDLIRKLAALANHPNTPPAEAAAARAKLKMLLERHNLTEEDISSERVFPWEIRWIPGHQKDLLISVMSMLLDSMTLPLGLRRDGKYWLARLTTTAADKIDIEACFSYYRKILEADRSRIQEEAKEKRATAKQLVKDAMTLTAGMKKDHAQ